MYMLRKKWFFGCPHRRTLLVLHGTKKVQLETRKDSLKGSPVGTARELFLVLDRKKGANSVG
jgi:hypothetical protein